MALISHVCTQQLLDHWHNNWVGLWFSDVSVMDRGHVNLEPNPSPPRHNGSMPILACSLLWCCFSCHLGWHMGPAKMRLANPFTPTTPQTKDVSCM